MATQQVVNWQNKKVGSIELDPAVFEAEVKKHILQTVVKWQLAGRRQGTHMVKTRALVRGGGKKPFKQKGTGNARQGSSRSPLMPGGAKLFGPSPRDYSYALPKKVRKLALVMALSHLKQEGKLTILDDMSASGKTKELVTNLKSLGLQKAFMIQVEKNVQTERAARNLPKFKYASVAGLNVFDLLKYDHLVIEKDAIEAVVKRVQIDQGAQ